MYDDLPEAEQRSVFGEYLAINDLPGTTAGFQLQPADTTTTVRVENGNTLTTDRCSASGRSSYMERAPLSQMSSA